MNSDIQEFYSIYITTPNLDEARTIGKTLVEERLAACVNFWEGVQSIYHWEGNLIEESECILIAKTNAVNLDELIKRTQELHSYEIPCIVVFPIKTGSDRFLNWIHQEVNNEYKLD